MRALHLTITIFTAQGEVLLTTLLDPSDALSLSHYIGGWAGTFGHNTGAEMCPCYA